jgi:hypothetical protein
MNAKCPNCSHRFRNGERRQFLTWHLSRRSAACPDCHVVLVWERKAHICIWGGMFLSAVFYGALIGTVYGQVVEDPIRAAWLIVLTVAALLLTIFGLWRSRLIRHGAA